VNVTTLVVLGTLAASQSAAQPTDAAAPQAVQTPPPAPDTRRQDIRVMETALTNALQQGARELARLLKVSEPGSAFVTGTGRARGFVLDGYGVFFDVDVPGMKQSVVWSAQMVSLAQERDQMIQTAATMSGADPRRPLVMARVRQIERLMAAAQAGQVLLPPMPSATTPTQLTRDRVEAANVAVASESVAVAAGTPAPSQAQMPEIRDPNELYTEAVKNALIDAMLRYSHFLKIGETEWLTVAASDSDGPPAPGQLDDTSRILISVRGIDLAAFQTGKLTREEVLKKVQVKEF
jgi:hypothetical protein